jgi:flagellar L-ring protein precursor FlgH
MASNMASKYPFGLWIVLVVVACLPLHAKARSAKNIQQEPLAAYIQRMQQQQLDLAPLNPGSLWTDNGRFAVVASDYKAARLGDLITIVVSQNLNAQSANNVSTNRAFSANSGISALAGQLKTTGVANIFSPTSNQALTGKSQAATTSSLVTNLAGRVAAVLPNGVMVVEAEREMTMNNEKQTLLVRGLVRPGDIGPDNSVSSNLIANLELELKGKGVLSDGTRPPNLVVRWILRVVGF